MTNKKITVTNPAPASSGEKPKSSSCLLRGCLIVGILLIMVFCCLGSLVALPFVTGFDPLGLDPENRFNEIIEWQDFIEDPSIVPDLFKEPSDPLVVEDDPVLGFPTPGPLAPTRPAPDARALSMATYTAPDFPAAFSYPAHWGLEEEPFRATFYDPDHDTILYVGEDPVEYGITAAQIAEEVSENLQADAQPGTFQIIENSPWSVPTGEDAHLSAFVWNDTSGSHRWSFDLEIVSGETNVFFFMVGEDPEQAFINAEVIELIAASFSR
ncbi:MAG: hypothetical protein WBB69_10595 [Anaerolineales bacterium]